MPDMFAIVTTGTGGYDKLEPQRRSRPEPGPGEVLLQVLAAGVNNTEINTRLGWYSASVETGTNQSSDAGGISDGGWNAATPFPFIQGTDCCGRVVEVGHGVDPARMGERGLVRACMRVNGFDRPDTHWMGSDIDGAFADFVKVPASEVFAVECDWTDAELATIPCAYGTAETMLERARVKSADRVLVTGASGGVGSATVQLAHRRGAEVIAIAGATKAETVRSIGADRVIPRGSDPLFELSSESMDVVIDNVAGDGFPTMLKLLRRGGRYASSGAIAGPMVSLDMRDMYLKDITLFGSTAWDETVFPNIVRYIEAGEVRPLLAKTYPLEEIAQAQADFLLKAHVGNFVLIPPAAR